MALLYIDSGVLIDACRRSGEAGQRALALIRDTSLAFASSDIVRLEVVPKALFTGRRAEATFYENCFAQVTSWVEVNPELVEAAFEVAVEFGLSAGDALHVAAAIAAGCDEFVTSEKPDKAIHRVKSIPVRSIR